MPRDDLKAHSQFAVLLCAQPVKVEHTFKRTMYPTLLCFAFPIVHRLILKLCTFPHTWPRVICACLCTCLWMCICPCTVMHIHMYKLWLTFDETANKLKATINNKWPQNNERTFRYRLTTTICILRCYSGSVGVSKSNLFPCKTLLKISLQCKSFLNSSSYHVFCAIQWKQSKVLCWGQAQQTYQGHQMLMKGQ